MEILNTLLPMLINVLLIVLLVCGIILIIKCIYIIDKVKAIALNVEEKVNSLNSLFAIVSTISDKVSGVTEKCISSIERFFIRLFSRENEDEIIEEEVKIKKERKK